MVMNFWEAQRKAKANTTLYLIVFALLTIIGATLAEIAMREFGGEGYDQPDMPYVGLAFLGITFLVASCNYLSYTNLGGAYVAESMNGRLITLNTVDQKEKQLLNIVQEIALASSLPVPPVYVIEAKEINAFAAGTTPYNAIIAVTRGTLEFLNRDELQGVVAHEFGHIYNGDMKIGMRVAAMIMGFFIISYIGLRFLSYSPFYGRSRSDDNDRNNSGNAVVIIALIFLAIGAFTWFLGSILQAMISRQREYLADACSVQYTRNPSGLAGALKKIDKYAKADMPKTGKAFAHLYFNQRPSFWSLLFATHPPIEKRIQAIENSSSINK